MLAILVCAAGLSGCGQKGPLFLPQDKLDEIKREREERENRKDRAPSSSEWRPAGDTARV